MDDILIDFPRRPLWRRAWTPTEQKVFAALVAVLGAFALLPVVAGSGPRDGDLVVANTHLAGSQSSPVLAALPDGKVVVVWEGAGPGDDDGVFARIRDPVGDAGFTDAEFLVNEETKGIQGEPAVAADADGNFLVAWVGPSADKQDGGQDVFTRLFDSTGTPQRGETEIHALPEAGASSPAAEGEEPSPPPEEPSPAPEEPSPPPEEPSPPPEEPSPPPEEPSPPPEEPSPPPEEEPSPPPEEEPSPPPEEEPGPAPAEPNPVIGDQSNPAVAALDGGHFAVAYEGSGTEVLSVTPPPADDPLAGVAPASDDQGIFLRYTGQDNEPSEVLVNSTSTDGQQRDPAVAASGSTVMVLWSGPGSGDEDVYAATMTGTVATEPFVVNTTTAGDQDEPAVVARGTDDFVAVWTGPDGDGDGIFLRGLQQPPSELLVNNLLITGDQRHPAVTISGSGLAVAWDGPGDADAGGIHVRRLDAGLNEGDVPTVIAVTTTPDAAHPVVAGNSAADYTVAFQGTGTASDVFVRRYAVNDAPVAAADTYDVEEDTTLSVDDDPPGVLDNDSDVDDDPITASVVSPPATGTLAFRPDGTFDYTPEPDANGTVTFTYQASDGAADSSPAVVTLNVIPFNDGGPTAMADAYAATEDIPFSVGAAGGVLANDDDPDDDSLKATLVESTTMGTLVLHEDGSFEYTTLLNSCEDDTFKY
ncbi:MAG: Ig-like domain-containing protein, partial [Acidimicrobiia bacterium]